MPRPKRSFEPARDHLTFGGRLPWGVGLLLVLTVVPSLIAAFGSRHVAPIFELAALDPQAVWQGQVWRLGTYALVEPGPFGLVLTCLCYVWFGRQLASEWGSGWFLKVMGGVAVFSSVVTCLVALVDPTVMARSYVGAWPLTTAVFVAWGLTFPYREALIFYVFPVRGWWAAWGTIALTVLYAAYGGWEGVMPELAAEVAIVGYLMRGETAGLRKLTLRVKGWWTERELRRVRKDRVKKARHLKVVEDDDVDVDGSEDLKRRIDEAVKKAGMRSGKGDSDAN